MYQLKIDFRRVLSALLALVLLSPAAHAELLDGELGQWLTDQVAPKLIRHVGKHPRFAGATLEVVTLDGQRPTATSNELIEAISEYLQHRLLEQSQARVAWSGSAGSCRPAAATTLLIGIEVSGSGSRHRVSIRALDPEEQVWIPGVSFRWQGQLAGAERRALRRAVAVGEQGTRARPFAADDRAAIADALVRQLECRPGLSLEGQFALAAIESSNENAPGPGLQPGLSKALEARLRQVPMLTIARRAADADWLVQLQARAEAPGLEELVLVASAGEAQQRLASIYVAVQNTPTAAIVRGDEAVREARRDNEAWSAPPQLLSELSRPDGEACARSVRPSRDEFCAVVELALEENGYLFSFRVENGRVASNQCGRPAEHSAPGRRRYRMVLDRDSNVTFYALATRDARMAMALSRLLNERGSGCGGSRRFDSAQWLERLERIIGRETTVEWRALELPGAATDLIANRYGG